jgi:hypothetical protein
MFYYSHALLVFIGGCFTFLAGSHDRTLFFLPIVVQYFLLTESHCSSDLTAAAISYVFMFTYHCFPWITSLTEHLYILHDWI